MNVQHKDPCCCKWGCECRIIDGQCHVCAAKIKRDAEKENKVVDPKQEKKV